MNLPLRTKDVKYVVVLSGGLDSTTLLYETLETGIVTSAVSFNYGQRHKKELEFAKRTTDKLGLKHHIIDLWSSGITDAIAGSGSSLVSDTPVPEGHYAEDTMKQTVVPNRNMMMLSLAGAIAVAEKAHFVATGVHAGDHFVYPDCRPNFIAHMSNALKVGNEGFGDLDGVWAPYMNVSKAEIALRAFKFGVPLEDTWSCYKGGDIHCGKCGTCVERLEAIAEAQEKIKFQDIPHMHCTDKTEYEDVEFWKRAIAEAGVR